MAEIESPEDEMVKLLLALKTEQSLRWQLEKPETPEELSYVFAPTEERVALIADYLTEYGEEFNASNGGN